MTNLYADMPTDEELLAAAREEGESDGSELLWDVERFQAQPLAHLTHSIASLWESYEVTCESLIQAVREETRIFADLEKYSDSSTGNFQNQEMRRKLNAQLRQAQMEKHISQVLIDKYNAQLRMLELAGKAK